jgi:hypothetical protein
MSAQNDFAQVITMLTNLNTISQNTNSSEANLTHLRNELSYAIGRMVSNNRNEAFRQQDFIRHQRALEQHRIRDHERQMTAPHPPAVVQPVRVVTQPRTRYNPLEKTKVIAKAKLEETIDCAICHETPKVKDCILTECNHYFCKGCWNGWMNAQRSNKNCPTCRKDMPRITSFRARASSKHTAVPVHDDDSVDSRTRMINWIMDDGSYDEDD